jgi:beta-galactosidase
MVDECDLAFENGYPGPLREVLGIWNEELDALPPEQQNRIVIVDDDESYTCSRLYALLRCEGAETLATYGEDFYAGTPVVTRHNFGAGQAYYLGSEPESRFLDDI